MAIYIINALVLPVYAMLVKNKKKLCIIISVQLFLIMAFRNKYLGVDLGGYENAYNDIQRFDLADLLTRFSFLQTIRVNEITSVEPGYIIVNWVFGRLGFSYHTFLILNAAFCMTAVGYFVYKCSDCPIMSFIIYLSAGPWYYSFGLLRQTIAMGLILFSIIAILENRNIKAFLLILLAVLFHRSSLFFLLLIPLAKIRIKKILYIVTLIFAGIIAFLGPLLVHQLIFPFLIYIGKTSYVEFLHNPISHLTIGLWLVAFTILLFVDFEVLANKTLNLMLWGFVLFVTIQGVARYVSTITRFQTVLIIMTGILLPNFFNRSSVRSNRELLSIACYLFFFVYMVISLRGSAIDPYISIFGYMPFPSIM